MDLQAIRRLLHGRQLEVYIKSTFQPIVYRHKTTETMHLIAPDIKNIFSWQLVRYK